MSGRFCYEGNIIPIFFRKRAGSVNIMTCSGCISAKNIHLPYFWRNSFHVLMGICTSTSIIDSISGWIIMIWNSHIPAMRIICGRSKNIPCFIETQAPGIIGRIGNKFQFTSIGFKAEKTLSKPDSILTCTNHSFKSGVPNSAPKPIIKTIMQI